jgi:hypothetical protein
MCKEMGIKLRKEHSYDRARIARSAETCNESKLSVLWNEKVKADRTVPNNKTDVIIRDNEKGISLLIQIAIS